MANEDFKIFLGDFVDALNEVADSLAKLRDKIAQLVGVVEEPYDIEKIKWEPAEGSSGAYEKSEDVNNPHFKALLRDVQAHGGKMTVGDYFVWSFKNGSVLGRKTRKR